MTEIKKLLVELETVILAAYEQGVTMEDAEKLAAKFLGAQLTISSELRNLDLEARMRKSGLKSLKAAVYMETVAAADKKPSDVMLEQIVNTDDIVKNEQGKFDQAEVDKEELDRAYSVAREGHIYFRGIAKGNFGA